MWDGKKIGYIALKHFLTLYLEEKALTKTISNVQCTQSGVKMVSSNLVVNGQVMT